MEEKPLHIDEVVKAYKAGQLKEVFGSGTAAVVAHVSKIQYQDTLMELPPMEEREIGTMVKAEIDGLRSGKIEDEFGWIEEVTSDVLADA